MYVVRVCRISRVSSIRAYQSLSTKKRTLFLQLRFGNLSTYSVVSKSNAESSLSVMASWGRFLLLLVLDLSTLASKVPFNSGQVLHPLTGLKYPTANLPVDLLLPQSDSTLFTKSTFPRVSSSPLPNQSILGDGIVDPRFDGSLRQGASRINGRSTYMNAVKTLVTMSQEDFTSVFRGGEFSFEGYKNVRISVQRATAPSTLQYRFAIYGLYSLVYHIARTSTLVDTTMTLYWTENDMKSTVGYIQIVPWPYPGIGASNETQTIVGLTQRSNVHPGISDVSNITTISVTNVSRDSNAPTFNVFAELQGSTLSIPDVFITLCLTLMTISPYPSTDVVTAFTAGEINTNARLNYIDPQPPRSSPPFFTYQYASRALGLIAKYLFQQGKFEDVLFVVEIDSIAVGIGMLEKGAIGPPETFAGDDTA